MKTQKNIWMRHLLAAAAVIALPLAVLGYASAGSGSEGHPPQIRADAPMPALLQSLFSEAPPPDAMLLPPHLRGLDLTAVQEDRLFALMREQALKERQQFNLAFQALEALRQPSSSAKFEPEKARRLANTYGQAVAQVVLMHAEFDARVHALLTPEQRQELDAVQRRSDPGKPHRVKG